MCVLSGGTCPCVRTWLPVEARACEQWGVPWFGVDLLRRCCLLPVAVWSAVSAGAPVPGWDVWAGLRVPDQLCTLHRIAMAAHVFIPASCVQLSHAAPSSPPPHFSVTINQLAHTSC